MGQKIHPYGFRLGFINGWKSNWYGGRAYGAMLHEDLRIREHIKKRVFHAGVSKIAIERRADKLAVNIFAARPGILIGKKGAEVDALRKEVSSFCQNEVFINIREVRKAELDGQLVAENIALQLERRVAFRRAMRRCVTSAMKFGAQGIKVMVSGRLGGSEMSRRAQYREGQVPLHTLRARIDYGQAIARTKSGVIGCKAWVFTGLVPDAQIRQPQLHSGGQGAE